MKEIFEGMLQAYEFNEEDAELSIDFVQELLEEIADYLEENEPLDTNTIVRLTTAIEEAKALRILLHSTL